MNHGNSVNLGSAFATTSDDLCEIGNDRISLALRAETGQPLRLASLAQGGERRWGSTGKAPVFSLVLAEGGPDRANEFRIVERAAWVEGETVRLAFRLVDDAGTTVTVHLECHQHQAVIRQWLEVAATTDVAIHRVEPFHLAVNASGLTDVHTVSGVQRQGGWRPDHGPYRSFRLERTSLQSPVRHESGLRSTWDETPWAALTP